jgi:nucleoside-diphosphate-sugar epimerase
MTRRHFVTGAQGFVGRNLVARILADDPDALVLGIGRSPASAPALARYRYRALPLLETASLREAIAEFRPDCVFHLASALHSAARHELVGTNVEGTASLVRALAGSDARMVFASSAAVYGDPISLPMDESHACAPVNEYGATKLVAEQLALHAPDVVIARIFNVVGPGQSADHVCGRIAAQLAAAQPLGRVSLVVGPLAPTRDFVDVRDVAAALIVLANRAPPGAVVNVASGVEVAIREVVSALVRAAGVEAHVVEGPGVAAGVLRSVADVTRLRQLGFRGAYSLDHSLRTVFESYAGRQPSAA